VRRFLLIPIGVYDLEFLIALLQQLQPLGAVDPGQLQGASVARRQARGVHVLVERLTVGPVEDYAVAQLFPQERFEESEDHFEDVRLVHDVNVFYSKGDAVL